jgi:predicted chitinase
MDEALINDWKYPLAHYSWRKLFVDEDNANRIKKIKDEEKFINMVTGTGTHKDNLFRHKDQDAIHHPIIQNNLNTIYGYKITDGQPSGFQIITETSANYGNKTRLYVYLFQKYYNNKEIPKGYRKDYKKRVEELRVDGIVDGKTLLAMDETLTEEWLYGDTIEPLLREKLGDELNEDLIKEIVVAMKCETAAANSALIKALVTHCKKFEIDTPLRLAHFLSQCAHESNDYKTTEESGAYSLDMARAIHPTKKAELEKLFKDDLEIEEGDKLATDEHHKKFFNLVYANKQSLGNGDEASGDGYRYRGRGYMQLTGRANYRKFLNYYNNGKADEDKIDIDSEDDLNRISASVDISVQVSAYYWKYIAPNLNNYAHLGKEEDHVLLIGAIINGIFWSDDECLPREPNHHDKRLAKFELAIKYFDDKIEALLRTEPRRQPRPRHASVSATTAN